MGSSTSLIVPSIMGLFYDIKPSSVLDIGIGTGKWGYLIRERVDLRLNKKKKDFRMLIDGVEIDKRWITTINKYIYDNIFVCDARKFKPSRNYDLILLGDIIEHMKKKEAYKMIENLLKYCKYIIISSPLGNCPTPNKTLAKEFPYEEHKSGWSHQDFQKYNLLSGDIKLPNFVVTLKGDIPINVKTR